jgi:hypothetical protein
VFLISGLCHRPGTQGRGGGALTVAIWSPPLPCPNDWLDLLAAAARWAPEAGVLFVVLSVGYRARRGRWPWRWPWERE